jgi:transposase
MALGKRKDQRQGELWIATPELPQSPGHIFYEKLNGLLAEAGFDPWVEALCEPYYSKVGRRGIPPGVYFRMLLVGYFEGIGSQRGIAWRCSDSLSLRKFLGLAQSESSPDHSSLTVIRNRLPLEVHNQVFLWVLTLAQEKSLLKGKTIAIDSTTLEANAAMKSIVRKNTGDDWKAYVTKLMQEAEVIAPDEAPSLTDLIRFDKSRKDKKVSNDEWESPVDPDARITKMKDGTTHLAYKAEHAVDLETEMLVAVEICQTTQGDAQTLEDTAHLAQHNLQQAGSDVQVEDVVADKGYHSARGLADMAENTAYRTYIPEPKLPEGKQHRWTDKPESYQEAALGNRRRTKGDRSKRLQRLRSELVERTFAHMCETGGARRTWLRGLESVNKRYLLSAAAHNLGLLMRKLFGMGTPRGLQGAVGALLCTFGTLWGIIKPRDASSAAQWDTPELRRAAPNQSVGAAWLISMVVGKSQHRHFSTGC